MINHRAYRSTMLAIDPTGKTHDRLAFTLCIAGAFHATLILGISFSPTDMFARKAPSRLEITLAQYQTDETINEADYLAQSNQRGSGSLKEKAELTNTQLSEFNDNQIRDIGQPQQLKSESTQQAPSKEQVSTHNSNTFKVSARKLLEGRPEPNPDIGPSGALARQSLDIASLDAKIADQDNNKTRNPRLQPQQVASTKGAVFAAYQHRWQRHIEHVGNRYYPAEARKQQLYGDLVLRVILDQQGSLLKLEVVSGSGHAVLDAAALNIVRGAAPFEPFTAEMRKENDKLEIIYKWQFVK